MTGCRVLQAVLLVGAVSSTSAAQTPGELIDAGMVAYRGLDFEAAAGLLRRGLAEDEGRLSPAARARALTYLGATEVYRENPDSARAVLRRLIRVHPRFEIDRLVFPPEVTEVFDAVRRDVKAVEVVVPDSVGLLPGAPAFTATLYATSFHEVTVQVAGADGREVRVLFRGPIGDSLTVAWDGLTTEGAPPPSGSYDLRVTSRDTDGSLARVVTVGLDVTVTRQDTLPHPPPPTAAMLLPERRPPEKGIEALGGAAFGLGVIGLSAAIAPGADLSGSRLLVAAALGITGVVGFVLNRPGAALPGNVAANNQVRSAWRLEVDAVAAANRRIRATNPMTIRRGPVRVLEPDR